MNKNRKAFPVTIFSAVLLMAMVCFFSPRFASAESHHDPLAQPTPPPLDKSLRIWPACTASDKLEITSFTITPALPANGQQVNIVMKVKNKCPVGTASLNVPWDIRKDSSRLAEGTVTLQPGETKDLSAQWRAVTGTFKFYGNADPANTISEADRSNNKTSDNRITVGTSSASTEGSDPVLVSQLLNHVKAKRAGANFTMNAAEFTLCGLSNNGGEPGSRMGDEDVQVLIGCVGLLVGGRGDFEGYLGFTLKNGWRVKSYEIVSVTGIYAEGPGKGWSWQSSPPSGTNPYFKLRLWAEANHGIALSMKITIEGPQGTDPYQ